MVAGVFPCQVTDPSFELNEIAYLQVKGNEAWKNLTQLFPNTKLMAPVENQLDRSITFFPLEVFRHKLSFHHSHDHCANSQPRGFDVITRGLLTQLIKHLFIGH